MPNGHVVHTEDSGRTDARSMTLEGDAHPQSSQRGWALLPVMSWKPAHPMGDSPGPTMTRTFAVHGEPALFASCFGTT